MASDEPGHLIGDKAEIRDQSRSFVLMGLAIVGAAAAISLLALVG